MQTPDRYCLSKKCAYCVLFGILACMIRTLIGVGSRHLFPFFHLCKDPEGGRISKQVPFFMEEMMKTLSRKISMLFVSSSHRDHQTMAQNPRHSRTSILTGSQGFAVPAYGLVKGKTAQEVVHNSSLVPSVLGYQRSSPFCSPVYHRTNQSYSCAWHWNICCNVSFISSIAFRTKGRILISWVP